MLKLKDSVKIFICTLVLFFLPAHWVAGATSLGLCEKLLPALRVDEEPQLPRQQPHLYRHGVILLVVDVVEAPNILWGRVSGKVGCVRKRMQTKHAFDETSVTVTMYAQRAEGI